MADVFPEEAAPSSPPSAGARSRTRERLTRRTAAALIAVLLLSGLLFMGCSIWIVHQAAPHEVANVAKAPTAQTAIVLGAVVYPDGSLSTIMEDRLETAVRLYKEGKVQKLLLSSGQVSSPYDQVGPLGRYVLEQGVAPQDVFLDYAGYDTLDTMYRARHVFGVTDALVVTQSFHLARSVYTARALGLEATGVSSDGRPYLNMGRLYVREAFARVKAMLELHLFRSKARELGPEMPISGDGRASWK